MTEKLGYSPIPYLNHLWYEDDANGDKLSYSDDDGDDNNFKIVWELKAGETYTISVNWYSSSKSGSIALIFTCEPINSEIVENV